MFYIDDGVSHRMRALSSDCERENLIHLRKCKMQEVETYNLYYTN